MASVDFQKLHTSSEVKAMLRHSDREERLKHEHANEHINKAMTPNNIQLKRNYDDVCKMYDERIEMLDNTTNTNKRKDRVTAFGLEIPIPEKIESTNANYVKFLRESYKILENRFGSENILQLYVHVDEQHEYIDSETKKDRMSLNHIQAYVMPVTDGQLNGKMFSSKQNMIDLNNEIHEMCKREFDCDFLDGTKKKSRKSVEHLKAESVERLRERERSVSERESVLNERERELQEKQENIRCYVQKLREREQSVSEREQAVSERESVLNERERELQNERKQNAKAIKYYAESVQRKQSAAGVISAPAKQEPQKEKEHGNI